MLLPLINNPKVHNDAAAQIINGNDTRQSDEMIIVRVWSSSNDAKDSEWLLASYRPRGCVPSIDTNTYHACRSSSFILVLYIHL